MLIHGLLKAAVPSELGRRVNWYYTVEVPDDEGYGGLLTAAQTICGERGWMLISVRPVSEQPCLQGIKNQNSEAPTA